jgi:transcriptional regulator with XRE-family HTH domain
MSETVEQGNASVDFGKYLKGLRKASGKAARIVALEAGMQPSNYSRMEYGVINPPKPKSNLDRLAKAVGILDSKEQMAHFYDMAAAALKSVPVDLADIISKDDAVPLMLRTIGNKKLTKQEVDEIVSLVRGRAD